MQANIVRVILFILLYLYNLEASEHKVLNSFSLVTMHMDYREYANNGEILDSEQSNFTELNGFYTDFAFYIDERETEASKIVFTFLALSGTTDYVGSYLGSTSGYGSLKSETINYIYDLSLAFEEEFYIDDEIQVQGGAALGYYFWNRELSVYQIEEYEWFSTRFYGKLSYLINNKFILKTSLAYHYALNPTMSVVDPAITFNLGSVNVLKTKLQASYILNEKIDFTLGYTYEYQVIEASDIEVYNGGVYYEPDSTSKNQYLEFGVRFKY